MKKICALLLACALLASSAACGNTDSSGQGGGKGSPQPDTAGAVQQEELVTIRAASLSKEIALPLYYIAENGLDTANGFKLELSPYDSGALVNEALGAGLWDVAALGSASVMSMAKYNCVHVFAHQSSSDGIYAMVRPDSEILSVKGYNPECPDIYGSPETVRGKTILVTIGSGNHMQISAWLNAIGLTDADVNLVHMEYAQAWQAFDAGEGDILSVTYPYTTYAIDGGYQIASDFEGIHIDYANNIIATQDFYQNHYDTLVALTKQIVLADEALQDIDEVVKWGMEWYRLNGNEINEQTAKTQFEVQPYYGLDAVNDAGFVPGDFLKAQADFSLSTGSISQEEYETVLKNIKTDVLDDVRKTLG